MTRNQLYDTACHVRDCNKIFCSDMGSPWTIISRRVSTWHMPNSLLTDKNERRLRRGVWTSLLFPSGGPSAPGRRFPSGGSCGGRRRRQNVWPRSSQAPPPHILRLRRDLCCWPTANKQSATRSERINLREGLPPNCKHFFRHIFIDYRRNGWHICANSSPAT